MIGRAKKIPQPNNSIKCLVNSCDYYGSGDHCYAQEIEIKSKVLANTSEMTDCATFISKELT
jgi:Domain of Unknown Function (DUF1540)